MRTVFIFFKDYDLENDAHCGFSYIRAREIDEMGIDAIVPILLSATFIATIGPVLVDKLFNCSKMLRMLFLGRR